MDTRKIEYIAPDEDTMQKEVEWALSTSMEQRMEMFFNHLATIYSLAGLDIYNLPVKKTIYYMAEDESRDK